MDSHGQDCVYENGALERCPDLARHVYLDECLSAA